MEECLAKSRAVDRWYRKNLNYFITYFMDRPEEFLLNEIELVKSKSNLKWKAALEYATFLKNKGEEKKLLNWSEKFLNENIDSSDDRNKLIEFISQIYYEKGDLEKFNELRKRGDLK